ncbi:RNA polymerase sigma factor [Halovulum sp. GXIMD14793]
MSDTDPKLLLQAMAGGDKAAFAALYKQLERPIYKFICSRLNDPFEASDILHEVFIDAWRSADRFEGRSSVKTWMMGIAYRKTMDRFRKMKRVTLTDETPEQVDDTATQIDLVAAGQEGEHIRFCLDELSDEHRMAVEMAFYEDMPYREIAIAADAPEGTIKTRIYHAKQLLKRCLSGRMGEVTL